MEYIAVFSSIIYYKAAFMARRFILNIFATGWEELE
jgi:hypothetical protein